MNKKILFLIILSVLALPGMVLAQGEGITIQSMIDAAVMLALYIGGAIVVILWVVTGILFLTALGDPSKLTLAKKALFASIIGTILIIVASSAVYLVGNAFNINVE
jgi:hypothetical protein